jgi:hypothetical protein
MLLPVIANTPRITVDLEWRNWSRYISSGLPVIVPTSPGGFYLSYAPTRGGRLEHFSHWIGRKISEFGGTIDPSSCQGTLDSIRPVRVAHLQAAAPLAAALWSTRGAAWDEKGKRPVELVALVDVNETVIGFGFPGFRRPAQSGNGPYRSAWNAIFSAEPGKTLHAYGILDDGKRICPLAGEHSFPTTSQNLASDRYVQAVEIKMGQPVRQEFTPQGRLDSLSMRFVSYGRAASLYGINWRVVAYRGGVPTELGAGTINAATIVDWDLVSLPISVISKEVPDQIAVTLDADSPANAPVGVALYSPIDPSNGVSATSGGSSVPNRAQLGLSLEYAWTQ